MLPKPVYVDKYTNHLVNYSKMEHLFQLIINKIHQFISEHVSDQVCTPLASKAGLEPLSLGYHRSLLKKTCDWLYEYLSLRTGKPGEDGMNRPRANFP